MHNFCPAKRGDLALMERQHSVTYAKGGTVRTSEHYLALVTNVSTEGRVTGYAYFTALGSELTQKPRRGVSVPCLVIPAERCDVAAAWEALKTKAFASTDEARNAIRPFTK